MYVDAIALSRPFGRRVTPVLLGVRAELPEVAGVRLDAAGGEGALHPGGGPGMHRPSREGPPAEGTRTVGARARNGPGSPPLAAKCRGRLGDWVKEDAVEPFAIAREPEGGESAVVVEVPHAGLWIDPESLAFTVAPRAASRGTRISTSTRSFQDAPREGATLLAARVSRFVVDLNRDEADMDGEAVEGGGRTLVTTRRRVASHHRRRRHPLRADPRAVSSSAGSTRSTGLYHRARPRRCSSASSTASATWSCSAPTRCPASLAPPAPLPPPRRASKPHPFLYRADLVPGTRGRTRRRRPRSSIGWTRTGKPLVSASGTTIPTAEAFSTAHYGRAARGVHAVQIEIARRLYMDETSLRIDPHGFQAVREFARTLAARLAFTEPDAPVRKLRGESSIDGAAEAPRPR